MYQRRIEAGDKGSLFLPRNVVGQFCIMWDMHFCPDREKYLSGDEGLRPLCVKFALYQV